MIKLRAVTVSSVDGTSDSHTSVLSFASAATRRLRAWRSKSSMTNRLSEYRYIKLIDQCEGLWSLYVSSLFATDIKKIHSILYALLSDPHYSVSVKYHEDCSMDITLTFITSKSGSVTTGQDNRASVCSWLKNISLSTCLLRVANT